MMSDYALCSAMRKKRLRCTFVTDELCSFALFVTISLRLAQKTASRSSRGRAAARYRNVKFGFEFGEKSFPAYGGWNI